MKYLIELFGGMPLGTVLIFLAAVVFIVGIFIKMYKSIIASHEYIRTREEKINSVAENVKELKKDYENLVTTVKEIKENQELLKVQQEELKDQCAEFENKTKKRDLNKLGDRLIQSYNYFISTDKNPLQAWTEMEEDAFYKLFTDYEELGGDGYMHSEVLPKMKMLKVVKMNDYTELANLYASRKG